MEALTNRLLNCMRYALSVNGSINKRFQCVHSLCTAANADLPSRIDTQVAANTTGRLFAIIYIQGKQRKVTTDDLVVVRKHLEADVGERIILNKVMAVGAAQFSMFGRPLLSPSQVRVEASIVEKTLAHTELSFIYLRRKSFRQTRLKKERLTVLRINSIELGPEQTIGERT